MILPIKNLIIEVRENIFNFNFLNIKIIPIFLMY
jgi:hypothetical protein